MTWLLRLYPPRWRRRYGAELAALVAAQPFSMGAAADLIAGAIDAWLHPQLIVPVTPAMRGDATMLTRMMRLDCGGYGPDVTAGDKARSAAVNVGGSLALALLWLWAIWQYRGNDYVLALVPMTYFLPYLVGLRYTALKGRSGRTQAIFIAGLGGALLVFSMAVGWLSSRI